MTGSAKDVGSGAVKGAALGAPLGPYGMAGGAVLGGMYNLLSGGESDEQKAADAANAAHIANGKQSAIALENYRQSARDQYHNLLTAETTPYQGYSNRLAAGWGTGMSTAGLSANENPLSLRDTGVGAMEGSNYSGYTTNDGLNGAPVRHQGIGAYVDHTDIPNGVKQTFTPQQVATAQGNTGGRMRPTEYVTADPLHSGMVSDTSLNPTYQPQSMALPRGGGQGGPAAGLSFAPRRAP